MSAAQSCVIATWLLFRSKLGLGAIPPVVLAVFKIVATVSSPASALPMFIMVTTHTKKLPIVRRLLRAYKELEHQTMDWGDTL
jgi:hypothetical protein